MTDPLMPKATAVWLIENTTLSFEQVAAFCGLHALEVQGIADGEVAAGIRGLDPVASGQLTLEEIRHCEADPKARLKLSRGVSNLPVRPKKTRYTPVSKRQERPNAIAWLVRNYPQLQDAQIARLLGTTKATIAKVRDKSHWNASNITPQDPILLGLCGEAELVAEINKAQRRLDREAAKAARAARRAEPPAETVVAAEQASAEPSESEAAPQAEGAGGEPDPGEAA